MMRTSPCQTCRCHGLPQVVLRPQLSWHVRFKINRHLHTVSAISPSYDVETRHVRMHWKGDDDTINLVNSSPSSRTFVDHAMWPRKVTCHLVLSQLCLVSSRAYGPCCGCPLWCTCKPQVAPHVQSTSVAAANQNQVLLRVFFVFKQSCYRFVKTQNEITLFICRSSLDRELHSFRALACVLCLASRDQPLWRGQPGYDTVDKPSPIHRLAQRPTGPLIAP